MADALTTIAEEIRKTLAPGHSDATRLIRLHTGNAVDQLLVERLDGVEQIGPASPSAEPCSAGFRFTLRVLCTNAALEAKDWLGKPVLIELLTQLSRIALRPFHGHITSFERMTSDGGFGYYTLTIEPWLAFLAHRRDSFVFHDMSIIEIIDSVLGDYTNAGTLVPDWKWALADASVYRKRSITTQYRESDLAFIERLLAEEGLYYWFEHSLGGGAATSSSDEGNKPASAPDTTQARHTLVIADSSDAFSDNAQARIRYHRASSTEQSDTIQRLTTSRSLATHTVEIASWDYRSLDTRSCSLGSAPDEAVANMPLTRFDAPGAYLWPDRETGERHAARQIEAIEAQRQQLTGSGTARTLAPGTRFVLDGHFDGLLDMAGSAASDDPDAVNRYAVLQVTHHARNNLAPSLKSGLADQALKLLGLKAKKNDKPDEEEPLYINHFTLLRADLPYRAATQDDHGIVLRPHPTAAGTQTAIVVGNAGEPVHTDRDGRIKIQFHWQRGANSHSRLAHTSDEDNAPGDQSAWSWVRVMTQWAGANWGSSFTPRVGQEVLVDFIEGDIDRPVVIGAAYNGQGAQSAQNNQTATGVGAATGNAPSWFAGEAADDNKSGKTESNTGNTGPGHAHRATLAGFKTQAMTQSPQGTGGYNQLVFDLSPGEPRTQLATTQFASSLTLGANRHQHDNQRAAYRGHGAELVTAESGAVRAGSGLLLSTDARANASGNLLDSQIAQAQLDAAQGLVKSLAESAQKQKAEIKGEPAAEKLAAAESLAKSQKVLDTTDTGSTISEQLAGGAGTVPAWSEPMIVAESPSGIAALTPKDAVLVAGNTLTLASADIHIASQGKQAWAVKDGIALYTYGKQSDNARPVKDLGLKLHAARGKVSVQAQSDKADFNADKAVTITSTTADVMLQGKDKLTVTAGGAAIEISGGNITLTASGVVDLKGGQRNFTTGLAVAGAGLTLPGAADIANPADVRKKTDLTVKFVDADGNSPASESVELRTHGGDMRSSVAERPNTSIPAGPLTIRQSTRKIQE